MIKKILCSLFLGTISLNAFSEEIVLCYEKLECPEDNKPSACRGIGPKADFWRSSRPFVIGSLKKGTQYFAGAYYYERSRIPAVCDYGSVYLDTQQRVNAYAIVDIPSHWFIRPYPRNGTCESTNPSECAFLKP